MDTQQRAAISIHAPHARSDFRLEFRDRLLEISIHAPHARSDKINDLQEAGETFQSTLLMRGATSLIAGPPDSRHFNPRSSCEERLARRASSTTSADFNPRSSCEERHGLLGPVRLSKYFNPRSSCEERRHRRRDRCREAISIHAPHARSD